MKAYKVFNNDWTCKKFKYEVGKSYHEDDISICSHGFHACSKISDCFDYYDFDKNNKVAEVELSGEIQKSDKDSKCCASDITIVKEITWEEVLTICNSGDCNSGNRNSGDYNSGSYNSGSYNSGDRNSGDYNSGNRNSGSYNSGNYNSGNWNSGNCNSGNRNIGDYNSGSYNSGNYNSGNWNSGSYNSGSYNSGFFNTQEPPVRMFNINTKKKIGEIEFPHFLYFDLTVWVSYDTATDKEKKEHKTEIETCGGFLKPLDYQEAFKLAWDNASEKDREKVKQLPNFDADIFYEISGIDLREV